jgi:hypothetical protein
VCGVGGDRNAEQVARNAEQGGAAKSGGSESGGFGLGPPATDGRLHPHNLDQIRFSDRVEVCVLRADRGVVGHSGRCDPSVHDLHRPPDRFEGNPQPRQFVPNRLVNHERLRNLPCRLQGAEATSHLFMAVGSQDAMTQLGKGHNADSNLIRKITERPLLLAGDEDRRVEYRLHAGARWLELIRRVRKGLVQLSGQVRVGLRRQNQFPRPRAGRPGGCVLDRNKVSRVASRDRNAQRLTGHHSAQYG